MTPPRKRATKTATKTKSRARRPKRPREHRVGAISLREIESLDDELERFVAAQKPPRWNASPEDVQRSVARLVLALVELLRRLMERQAIRRMEADTLTPQEVERVGLALMRLEETVRDLCARFGIDPNELNLDLGPLGKLY